MPKKIVPPRNQPLVNPNLTPTKRTASFLEEVSREASAIANVALSSPSANEALLEDAVNDILAALREKGIIQE